MPQPHQAGLSRTAAISAVKFLRDSQRSAVQKPHCGVGGGCEGRLRAVHVDRQRFKRVIIAAVRKAPVSPPSGLNLTSHTTALF